jgi:multidrug efflux pump subunit AcrB
MFMPLALSIAFAMIISYVAAQTLVPILANWLLKTEDHGGAGGHAGAGAGSRSEAAAFMNDNDGLALNRPEVEEVVVHARRDAQHKEEKGLFGMMKIGLLRRLDAWMPRRKVIVLCYLAGTLGLAALCLSVIGKDMLPHTNAGQMQLRIREPDGMRLEVTERTVKGILNNIDSLVGGHISISSAFVGTVSPNYGHSNLYVFNSGSHEAVLQIQLDESYKVNMDELWSRSTRRCGYPSSRSS